MTEAWTKANVYLIHKKGYKLHCEKYREQHNALENKLKDYMSNIHFERNTS